MCDKITILVSYLCYFYTKEVFKIKNRYFSKHISSKLTHKI